MAVSSGSKSRVAGFSFVLFCASLFLTAYSARDPRVAGFGAALLGEILRPVQIVNYWIHDQVGGVWDSYFALVGVQEENQTLRDRLAGLEQENLRLLEVQAENQRLASLLELKQEAELSGIVASVIGYDPTNWTSGVTLDRGSLDGVRVGMAVAERNGLVGQVITTSPHSSRVLLITDPASGVDGLLQETRARGIVEGTGSARLRWSFVLREDQVELGDRVVTSGMDGIYPKGLLIGVVAEVEARQSGMFQAIELEPTVDFSRLETVMIVSAKQGSEEPTRPLYETRERPTPETKSETKPKKH